MNKAALLVDDDHHIRAFVSTVLYRSGWRVLEADTGADAIAHCNQHLGPIKLLIADVNLPDTSGIDVARMIAAIRPEINVLLVSGGSAGAGDFAFLRKPFTIKDLGAKINQVLAF